MSVAFLLMVAFVPFISGVATSPRWAIAGICAAYMAQWHTTIVIFATYALLSVAWAPNKYDAILQFAQLLTLCCTFTWGYYAKSITRIIQGCALGVAVSGVIAALQYAGVPLPIEQGAAPSGLFFNKNFLGEISALSFIACISHRMWLYCWMPALPLILSQCRSAWLAVAVSLFLMMNAHWRTVMILLCGITLAFLPAHLLNLSSLYERLGIWDDAIHHLTFWGHGIGSYNGASIDNIATRTFEMHNDWLQFAYELGLPAFAGVAIYLYRVWSPFTCCLLIIASFGFPLHLPATGWFAALVCGHLLGLSDERRRILLRERMEDRQLFPFTLRTFGLPVR